MQNPTSKLPKLQTVDVRQSPELVDGKLLPHPKVHLFYRLINIAKKSLEERARRDPEYALTAEFQEQCRVSITALGEIFETLDEYDIRYQPKQRYPNLELDGAMLKVIPTSRPQTRTKRVGSKRRRY